MGEVISFDSRRQRPVSVTLHDLYDITVKVEDGDLSMYTVFAGYKTPIPANVRAAFAEDMYILADMAEDQFYKEEQDDDHKLLAEVRIYASGRIVTNWRKDSPFNTPVRRLWIDRKLDYARMRLTDGRFPLFASLRDLLYKLLKPKDENP